MIEMFLIKRAVQSSRVIKGLKLNSISTCLTTRPHELDELALASIILFLARKQNDTHQDWLNNCSVWSYHITFPLSKFPYSKETMKEKQTREELKGQERTVAHLDARFFSTAGFSYSQLFHRLCTSLQPSAMCRLHWR